MKATVRSHHEGGEYLSSENCRILELSNSPGDPDVSIARARVAPGVSTRWHRLRGVAERYVILSGRGRVEVGDDLTALVGHGDVVLIPPGCRQRITNTGDGELVFLAVCTPRYNDAVYEDVDGASPGSDPSAPTPLPPPEDG